MLWLASASPARRRLLEQAGIPHQVRVSGFDEEAIQADDPRQLVQRLALAKARVVFDALNASDPALRVLGCDSLLTVEGVVYGKPRDAAEASARWRSMAGGWGELHTGHCLLRPAVAAGEAARTAVRSPGTHTPEEGTNEQADAVDPAGPSALIQLTTVTTRVQFAALSDAEIAAYVATGEPLQCAGGFALEGRGGLLVEQIEGCFSNVIGLSLPLLRRWLS